jgi:hypothetical protein
MTTTRQEVDSFIGHARLLAFVAPGSDILGKPRDASMIILYAHVVRDSNIIPPALYAHCGH